jgi:RsiW-degrading membrane proteinase PrsW (M82 family)
LTTAVEVVTRYVPTEIVTAYVAVATLVIRPGGPRTAQWVVFYVFFVLTPVMVWLFSATRARSAGEPLPWHPGRWPVFELVIATVSFVLWAFALPSTPFEDFTWYQAVYGAAALIIGSLLIGAIAPVFRPKQ